jgi:hypothetical protein
MAPPFVRILVNLWSQSNGVATILDNGRVGQRKANGSASRNALIIAGKIQHFFQGKCLLPAPWAGRNISNPQSRLDAINVRCCSFISFRKDQDMEWWFWVLLLVLVGLVGVLIFLRTRRTDD